MKKFLLTMILAITTMGFSNDRFYSEHEIQENLMITLLSQASKDIASLEQKQETIIELLSSILEVIEPHKIDEWKDLKSSMD